MIDLFIVLPYLTRIVSGSSNMISDAGRSKKFALQSKIVFSFVSIISAVYNNSIVKIAEAFDDIFPNSLFAIFRFLYPLEITSFIYYELLT